MTDGVHKRTRRPKWLQRCVRKDSLELYTLGAETVEAVQNRTGKRLVRATILQERVEIRTVGSIVDVQVSSSGPLSK